MGPGGSWQEYMHLLSFLAQILISWVQLFSAAVLGATAPGSLAAMVPHFEFTNGKLAHSPSGLRTQWAELLS